jgi:hypothetical protein
MPYGLYLTVTHTGTTAAGLLLNDIFPTTDGHTAFRRAGPVYVPVGGTITLTYTDTVSTSFESGTIRGFVDLGYLTATLSFAGTGVTFPPSSGDLSGTYPNITVVGIQGFAIQNGVGPNNGDALLYNSLTSQWEHAPIVFGGGPPVGPAGGDLGGLYPNPSVTGLQTDPLPATVADGFLKRNALNTGWEEVTYGSAANTVCEGDDARLSDARAPTGAAGGDLTGTYPNPTIAALAVTDSKVAVANKDGLAAVASMRTLGAGATQACAGNDARLSDARTPTGAAGGDLTGTYPNPTLVAVGAAGTYGSSTSIPVLTTDTKGRVTGVVDTPITTLGVGAYPRLGNTVVVDGVNGNDLTGTVNGLPVATVEQGLALALAAAPTPITVWVAPGTYTLASATTGITIPDGCSIRGLSLQTTRIVMVGTNPGSTVTLLTMGENSRVEDLSLTLTSTNATTNLIGINMPGTTSATSKVRTSVVTVDNSGLAVGTTTTVYGVYSAGTGALNAATFSFNCLKGSTLNVRSNGAGDKFGIYQPAAGGGNQLSTRDFNLYVAAPTDATSTGLYVGIYTDNANSQIQTRSTSIAGSPYPAVQLKLPVSVVSVVNIALTGTYTLQGVALAAGDRVLAAGQTVGANNGIWVVAAGAWTRAVDMAAGSPALGAYTFANRGTYTHTGWECTTNLNVGAGALTFVQRYAGCDILQSAPQAGNGTNGIQLGPGTDIVNKTAGTHAFTTYVTPTTLQFCLRGNVDAGTHYLWPGTLVNSMDNTEVFYRFQQRSVLQGMYVNVRTAPGVGKDLTITLNKSTTGVSGTGARTLMRATVSGTDTSATNYLASVDFAQGEYLSVQVDLTTGASAADMVVEIDLF